MSCPEVALQQANIKMTKKLKQNSFSSPLSGDPYKRREESEIIKSLLKDQKNYFQRQV